MSIKFCCDFCDKPLEIVDVDVVDRVEGFDYAKYYVTKELNTTKIFPILCENCAMKLDKLLVFAKDEWLKQIDISDRNSKINAARRELLGSKG